MKSSDKKNIEFEKAPLSNFSDSTYQAIKESAALYSTRIALKFFLQGTNFKEVNQWSYKELLEEINATSNMLRDLGVMDKDVVSYILPNIPETVFTVFGGEATGIVNAINPFLEPEQLAEIMNEAGTKVLVTLSQSPGYDIWGKVSNALLSVPTLETVITVDMNRYLNPIESELQINYKETSVPENIRLLDFHSTVKKYPKENLSFQRKIKPGDIASYFHTGGTTGKPKIAQHTHQNEIANASGLLNWLNLQGYKTFFCGLPWFHVNGLIVTGVAPLLSGNCILLATPAGYRGEGVIKNFWKIVEHFQVSFFSSVPTTLQMILETPQEGENISSLEYTLCGAAPLSNKLINDFEKNTGVKIIEGYGFTEGTCVNSANPVVGERKIGSIGLALPNHHMKIAIIDEKTGRYLRDAETDEIGVIICRGINVFPGYKEEIHNSNIWVNDGKHLWYNTGDLGRKDFDNYFYITGRKKELIIRGGHNIDPKSIEEPLSQHPAIATVAAIGSMDKRLGEVPVVYVQLKPNMTVTKEELMTYAKQNITERAAIPKEINIVESIPLTAVGKVYKPELIQTEIKKVFSKELKNIPEIEHFEINVEQNPKFGVVVQIEIRGNDCNIIEKTIKNMLGNYTVKYELLFNNTKND